MTKETNKYIDDVAELLETVGMKEGVKLLQEHDKTRTYTLIESEPMGRIYFSSIKEQK